MLSSAEVGTLITALGCGIGRDEYDPDKLRYHRIIIMTDADVDGSHIRTLLLTFFYRQMTELVERGHIYIAQPPLYKLKKGKQERYVKDDHELDSYLLELGMQDAALYTAEDAQPVSEDSLLGLGQDYLVLMETLQRLAGRYDRAILMEMREMETLDSSACSSRENLSAWLAELEQRLRQRNELHQYDTRVDKDAESAEYFAVVQSIVHGVEVENVFNRQFFASSEYRNLVTRARDMDGLMSETAYIQRGESRQPVSTVKQAFDWLLREARKGLHIQRYKGLGEMNPEQLWETTLDAESRNLMQVRIEDVVAADEIFTTLMGDQVEPRREFIIDNALEVKNLDV